MTIIEDKSGIYDRIKDFEAFAGVKRETLEWLIERSEYLILEPGSYFFQPGDAIDQMIIVLEGKYSFQVPQANGLKDLGTFSGGRVTGVLPYSRMEVAQGYGTVKEKMHLLTFHRDGFQELVCKDYQLAKNLVATMTNRVRNFSDRRSMDEKLMSLGKLSAGLAHELNNPASAMVRSAQRLRDNIHQTPEKFKSVMTMRISHDQTDKVNKILFDKIDSGVKNDLSLIERESQKDDILDWLEDAGIEEADEMAETYVDFGITEEDLDYIAEVTEHQFLPPILSWIESTLRKEILIEEIQEAANRIAELVKSIKSYSHMDRGDSIVKFDIHKGIRNTLIMLKHKIKKKAIFLDEVFDQSIPQIEAHPGELNQVWTNLVDNAIDAMGDEGKLTIKTYQEFGNVCIEISDTGKGIPAEHLNRIYDPFFTTKPVGKGTGLGLDIVRKIVLKHKGTIEVTSVPGNTTFKICIPIVCKINDSDPNSKV